MLKSWNPSWEPMMDYSDTEMAAVNSLSSSTQVYLCELHRKQAWERWVKEQQYGLNDRPVHFWTCYKTANAQPNWNNLPTTTSSKPSSNCNHLGYEKEIRTFNSGSTQTGLIALR